MTADITKMTREQLEVERFRLQEKANAEYWAFTRQARAKPVPSDALHQLHEVEVLLGLRKEWWERTQKNVYGIDRMPPSKHKKYVEQALRDGKPVPLDVLADYPDLMEILKFSQPNLFEAQP